MVSQSIWIGIVIGVFFIGIGLSYAHFANTYDPMSMKFQNQGLFDQMSITYTNSYKKYYNYNSNPDWLAYHNLGHVSYYLI